MTTQIQPPGCDEARMAVLARLDGEPARLTSEEVDAHTASCGACQAALADFRAMHGALDRMDYSVSTWICGRRCVSGSEQMRPLEWQRAGASRADRCARRVATRPAAPRVARAGHQFNRATRAHCGGASLAHGRSICHSHVFTFATAGRCVMNQTDSNVVLAQRYA